MLVLDANILIRAVLGSRVLTLLRRYAETAEFVAPWSAFEEAREQLPAILERRGVPVAHALLTLDVIAAQVRTIELEDCLPFEAVARHRLARRDEDDWPMLAAALALNCPIWTEDLDFFGCGVPTWTSDRVELYLEEAASGRPC